VQLTASKKHPREAAVAMHNQISSKDFIRVSIEKMGNRNLYKVTLGVPLPPGEYAFISSAPLSNDVFDFGVDSPSAQ
jgi:hypothetical protein